MPRAKAYKADLDFKRVEKCVRRAPALLLPTGWRDWPKGLPPLKHKLPIDDELAQLPSGRKRILSADEVRARYPEIYWPSHQVAIRLQLLWYVNFEFLDSITADTEVAQFHRRQLNLLESAEAPLLEFLRLINARLTVQFVPPVERDLISNVRSAIEPVEKLKNWVTWCLRETRPFEGGRPVVDWKRQFVLRLAALRRASSAPPIWSTYVDCPWTASSRPPTAAC